MSGGRPPKAGTGVQLQEVLRAQTPSKPCSPILRAWPSSLWPKRAARVPVIMCSKQQSCKKKRERGICLLCFKEDSWKLYLTLQLICHGSELRDLWERLENVILLLGSHMPSQKLGVRTPWKTFQLHNLFSPISHYSPLTHCAPARFPLFLKQAKPLPAPKPLLLQGLLPHTLVLTCLVSAPQLNCHFLGEPFLDNCM